MSRLSLVCFGSFQVTLAGERLTSFHSVKVQALLAYLALEAARPHTREALMALFWPEDAPQSAQQSLRQALYALRRALGDTENSGREPFLLVTRQTVQLNPAAAVALDVTTFLQQVQQGNLAQAIPLYQADLLVGMSTDSAPFAEWLIGTREYLHTIGIKALDQLTQQQIDQGSYPQAVTSARRQLVLEPWREEAHRQLMTALARSGERSAALAQYDTCRHILADELGVEPAAETTTLYTQIRDGQVTATPNTLAPPPVIRSSGHPVIAPPRHNLPPQPTPFIGRQTDLEQIAARLQDHTCRLLTIVGPGGMGKTRLAIQAAQAILDFRFWILDSEKTPQDKPKSKIQNPKFEDGVFFVGLAGVGSPDLLVSAIAAALDFTVYGSGDLKTQLLGYLRSRSVLIVLDNCEHLLNGIDLVVDLLDAAPHVKVLATSREPLNLHGEWLHLLSGMSFPADGTEAAAMPTAAIAHYTAVQLFAQCARQFQPTFDLADTGNAVARICQLAGGMPLAIELAASWLKFYPCAQIAQEMGRSLDFLVTKLRNVSPRHRSMRAVFEHSWALLSAEEQQVLQQLALFRGDFRLEAAQQVAEASFPRLVSLAEKSLVQPTHRGRYQMHELLRQFAEEKLRTIPNNYTQVQARYSTYYCTWLHECMPKLQTAADKLTLSEIEMEIHNVRAAWLWAAAQKAVNTLTQATDALFLFFYRYNRLSEGIYLCQCAIDPLAASTCAAEQTLLARLLIWQGRLAIVAGKHTQARDALEQSLSLLSLLTTPNQDFNREMANVLMLLGHITYQSDPRRAEQFYAQALTFFRMLHDKLEIANALSALATVQLDLGSITEARRLNEESLALRRTIGVTHAITQSLHDLAECALLTGEFAYSKRLIEEAQQLCLRAGDQAQTAYTLDFCGQLAAATCNYIAALEFFNQSIALLKAIDREYEIIRPLYNRALTKLSLGQYPEMKQDIEENFALLQQNERVEMIANNMFAQACWQVAMRQEQVAWQTLQDARQQFCTLALLRGVAQTDALSAYLLYRLEQPGLAQLCAQVTLQSALNLRIYLPIAFVLPTIALLLAEQGEAERAVALYAFAQQQPYVGQSAYFSQLAAETLVTASQQLAPAIVAGASTRWAGFDLAQVARALLLELEDLGWPAPKQNEQIWPNAVWSKNRLNWISGA